MAEHKEIYQRAKYYDIAFSRDVHREILFMQNAFQRYAGRKLSSIIDIACGPGYHACAAAGMGMRALGMDLRPEMLDFAKQQAPDTPVDWIVGNMCDFKLDKPVDMAGCFLDSIDAMLTDKMMVEHFCAVANNLTPKGLYIIECIHSRDCSPTHYGLHRHRGSRDGILVEMVTGTNRPEFDPVTGIGEVEYQMHIFDNGLEQHTSEKSHERLYSPQVINLLAEKSGVLKVVGWFGDFNLDQPLDNTPRSQGMIALLQKTEV